MANGIGNAMKQVRIREGPDDDDDMELASSERTKMTELANAGALPPAENDDEREVDVLSEPPEIDTTRADKPPMMTPTCASRTRQAILILFCLSTISTAIVVGIYASDLWESNCDSSRLSDSSVIDSIGKRMSAMSNTTNALIQSACSSTKSIVDGR